MAAAALAQLEELQFSEVMEDLLLPLWVVDPQVVFQAAAEEVMQLLGGLLAPAVKFVYGFKRLLK
jgi:hypothetical protein